MQEMRSISLRFRVAHYPPQPPKPNLSKSKAGFGLGSRRYQLAEMDSKDSSVPQESSVKKSGFAGCALSKVRGTPRFFDRRACPGDNSTA
jgi:hypothetical protein